MKRERECLECGAPFDTKHQGEHIYHTPECRKKFGNRRMTRGALVYDLIMAIRFEREEAEREKLWTMLCRLCADFKDEDDKERGGRKSWGPWQQILMNHPHLRAPVETVNGR